MKCKDCGGNMIGDGFTIAVHCEFAFVPEDREPDSAPLHCGCKAHGYTCPDCNGSGEGSHDGSTCRTCRGNGECVQHLAEFMAK